MRKDLEQMKRAILLLALISAPAGAQTLSKNGLETANYKYVAVRIESATVDAGSIDLTEDRIRTHVELRLRSAGLTPGDDLMKNKAFLYVKINVRGAAVHLAVEYARRVVFTTDDRPYRYVAKTWQSVGVGTHAGDTAYIMEGLDAHLDRFLNEYLKVNQK